MTSHDVVMNILQLRKRVSQRSLDHLHGKRKRIENIFSTVSKLHKYTFIRIELSQSGPICGVTDRVRIIPAQISYLIFLVNYLVAYLNTLRPRQNGRHFPDDIFKCIFLNENAWISIKIPLKFIPRDRVNSIPALAKLMAWCRPGEKPLSEPMMISLSTHICVTRPQ